MRVASVGGGYGGPAAGNQSAGPTFTDVLASHRLAAANSGTAASAPTNAAGLISAATDPTTGRIDTATLAAVVADAGHHDFSKASDAYSSIKAQLGNHSPVDAARFDHDVSQAFVRGAADTAAGISRGLSAGGKKLLIDNPILTKQWQSTTSMWTGKGGFTQGLRDLLTRNGIDVAPGVNPPPPGSLGRSSGVPAAQANNTNGSLARDAIASRYSGPQYRVQTEVPTQNGKRVNDVRVDIKAKDPRYSQRIEIESKVGRTSRSPRIADEVAKDAKDLADNAKMRGAGAALETAGKVMLPVAVAADGYELFNAYQQDGGHIGMHTGEAAAGIAGSWGGAIAGAEVGAEIGATIGSVVPGAGTAVGGVVGGIVGGIVGGVAGDSVGRHLFDDIASLF